MFTLKEKKVIMLFLIDVLRTLMLLKLILWMILWNGGLYKIVKFTQQTEWQLTKKKLKWFWAVNKAHTWRWVLKNIKSKHPLILGIIWRLYSWVILSGFSSDLASCLIVIDSSRTQSFLDYVNFSLPSKFYVTAHFNIKKKSYNICAIMLTVH